MITEYLKAPPYKFITLIVETQLVLTIVSAGVIILLLVKRNRGAILEAKLKERFAEKLVTELIDVSESNLVLTTIEPYSVTEREVLQSILLEHLRVVEGSEREYVVRRYEELGFVAADLRQIKSFFWWRRLRAASNLAALESDHFATEFLRLTGDRHRLVAALAYYALSGLKHPANQPVPIAQIPQYIRSRRNLMVEILLNWARLHSTALITDQISTTEDPVLLEVLIAAAAASPTPEVASAFAELLGRDRLFAPQLIEPMLVLLRTVGDPSFIAGCQRYVRHPNEIVRLRTLEYLVSVGEDQILSSAVVKRDASALVRRAVRAWNQERAAA